MIEMGLDFDDVLILPQPSNVNHRGDVDLSTWLGNEFTLQLPIMAAPMKGIVGPKLISELGELGGLGFLHRFHSGIADYVADGLDIFTDNFGTSIPLNNDVYDYQDQLDNGSKIICVDTANGYLKDVVNKCEEVANFINLKGYEAFVMGGCVVTAKGCDRLFDAGCKFIRVGIGSGALCSTRNATGIGRPQISAIMDCSRSDKEYYVVADGGIRNSGDAAKALGAGADFVMMGTWFAQALESENDGIIYGMASAHNQLVSTGRTKSIEGLAIEAKREVSLSIMLDKFAWNLKSAFTYVGANNIAEFQARCKFVQVSDHAIKKDII